MADEELQSSPEDGGEEMTPPTEEESGDPEEPGPSLYNFNLQSADGVERILALLPILDEDILKALYQECFPGYPLDNVAPRMARIELRGFFMDFLDGTAA